MKCRICGNEKKHKSVELIGTCYGTEGSWKYIKCGHCGLLQIKDIPENLGSFYNSEYYSMHTEDESLRSKLWDMLFKYQISGKSLIGKAINIVFPSNYSFMRGVSIDVSILDVGCGDGKRLRQLARYGFTNLTGVEPYIEASLDINEKGTKIHIEKNTLEDYSTEAKYDYIIFEHSLEHVIDEFSSVKAAANLLKPDGRLIIKLPFYSNFYWSKYGKYQYILDPPRHLYIHTYDSINALVTANDMIIIDYSTETEPIMKLAAKNIKKGRTDLNYKYPFFELFLEGILSYPTRKRQDKKKDGACATFIIKKNT